MVVLGLTLVALGALWAGTRIDAAFALQRRGHEGLPSVVVREGDTLWGIASAVATERDLASEIRLIMDLNDLSGSVIRPGARLYLPEGSAR